MIKKNIFTGLKFLCGTYFILMFFPIPPVATRWTLQRVFVCTVSISLSVSEEVWFPFLQTAYVSLEQTAEP